MLTRTPIASAKQAHVPEGAAEVLERGAEVATLVGREEERGRLAPLTRGRAGTLALGGRVNEKEHGRGLLREGLRQVAPAELTLSGAAICNLYQSRGLVLQPVPPTLKLDRHPKPLRG